MIVLFFEPKYTFIKIKTQKVYAMDKESSSIVQSIAVK